MARSMISSASIPALRFDVGQRDRTLGEAAGSRAVVETPFGHRPRQDLLDRQRVEDRLQRRAAADDRPRRRAVAAGLVIGDAQLR